MNEQRAQISTEIRRKLYVADSNDINRIAKAIGVETAGLTDVQVLSQIEVKLINCEKDEDEGKDFLSRMVDLTRVESTADKNPFRFTGFHRDYKLSGQIGEGSNALPYMSFLRQVQSGVDKGYGEQDIVDGIIRAIQPSSKLRGYLEGREDLSLTVIKDIIRTYYKESSATELYQELCVLAQTPKESPQEFVLRALELKQKIIFADKESSTKYGTALIDKLFRQSVETGIRDDGLRVELASVLKSFKTDEELLQNINDITRKQGERASKINSKEKSVKALLTEPEGRLLTELKALRVEVGELKGRFEKAERNGETAPSSGGRFPRRRGQCKRCYENQVLRCDHCFRCGQLGHRRGDPQCPSQKPTEN